jgi:formyltetrahydrofolate-dependent phosphoribosylglycinamide formyltransferase
MAHDSQSPLPLAVLISGRGMTLRNLLEKIDRGEVPASVQIVISSNPAAWGLQFARERAIPWQVIQRRAYGSAAEYSQAVFASVRAAGAQLVVLAGFLKLLRIPPDFQNRVMNIHPALIPAFCGAGYYGHRVHEAVLEYGCKLSGCTVHFVDNQYDHGPVILQKAVPVLDGDTPDTLAARVFEAECELYPRAIRLFAEGRLRVEGRWVRIT